MKRLLWLVASVLALSLTVAGVSLLPPDAISGWGAREPIRVVRSIDSFWFDIVTLPPKNYD